MAAVADTEVLDEYDADEDSCEAEGTVASVNVMQTMDTAASDEEATEVVRVTEGGAAVTGVEEGGAAARCDPQRRQQVRWADQEGRGREPTQEGVTDGNVVAAGVVDPAKDLPPSGTRTAQASRRQVKTKGRLKRRRL